MYNYELWEKDDIIARLLTIEKFNIILAEYIETTMEPTPYCQMVHSKEYLKLNNNYYPYPTIN